MTKLTADQIKSVYKLKLADKTLKEIQAETGVIVPNVYSVLEILPKHLRREPVPEHLKARSINYILAAEQLLEENPNIEIYTRKHYKKRKTTSVIVPKVPKTEPLIDSPDRFSRLNKAFEVFEKAVSEFIEEEYTAKQESLVKEYSELKVAHEASLIENEELRKVAHSSGGFMNRLKLRFGYKPQIDSSK